MQTAALRRLGPCARWWVAAFALLPLVFVVACEKPSAVPSPVPEHIDVCPPQRALRAQDFRSPTKIDNVYFPLVPGTQVVLEGRSNLGAGDRAHAVSFTVTDVTKVIDGVRTVAVWDRDIHDGTLLEEELAFFAQDDGGNVWNFGEYPEEIGPDTITAPSTWLSGVAGAVAGLHMVKSPRPSETWYLQGWAPDSAFFDCGNLWRVNESITVPAGKYSGVVVTRENSPLDETGGKAIQLKYHVRGIGIAQVGALEDDPQAEALALRERTVLTPEQRREANVRTLELDARAYRMAESVWARSERATLERAP